MVELPLTDTLHHITQVSDVLQGWWLERCQEGEQKAPLAV